MAHRAQAIIDLVATFLRANTAIAHVYTHRSSSLSAEEIELPCVTVNYGPDSPAPSHLNAIGSALEVVVTCVVVGVNEAEVLTALLELRRQTHIALMADSDLGLTYVRECLYGGADAPQLQQVDQMTGVLPTRWVVQYDMNISDPQ